MRWDIEDGNWCWGKGSEKWDELETHYEETEYGDLHFAERFLDWYPIHTNLYIRGYRGKDSETKRELDSELYRVLAPFFGRLKCEARLEAFEAAMQAYLKSNSADLIAKINDTGDYNDDIAAQMKAAIEAFKSSSTY